MVSVIIPTLNEEEYIQRSLFNLQFEKIDHEVIIADAGSIDKTLDLVALYGAKVVKGGLPPVGRNNGAKHAKGDILVFLDADTYFRKGDLTKAVETFKKKRLDLATCVTRTYDGTFSDKRIYEIMNNLIIAQAQIKPQFPGYCIIVKKSIHDKINGFDESIRFMEDAEYTERASKHAKAGVIMQVKVYTSSRRLHSTSRIKVIRTFLSGYGYRLLKKEDTGNRFDYEFDIYNDNEDGEE